jgi:hypothetical protein
MDISGFRPWRWALLALVTPVPATAAGQATPAEPRQVSAPAGAPAAAPAAVREPTTTSVPMPNRALRHSVVVREDKARFVAHVVEIDLSAADIAFVTTQADVSGGMEFVALRTSTVLDRLHALLAVNASYFLPFAGGSPGGEDYYPHEGDPANASGAVVASGGVASPVETDLDLRVNAILCFEGLAIAIADGQVCPAGFSSGIAAGPRMLASGVRRSFETFDNNYAATPQPRTAIGISADRKRAWIVVVDGRQKGYSDGATLAALSTLFLELGASDAINLDGGGSSTLAVAGEDGAAQVINRPIHTGVPGRERPVANHLVLVPLAQKP